MGIFQSTNSNQNTQDLSPVMKEYIDQKLKEACESHRQMSDKKEDGAKNEEFENLRKKHESLLEERGKQVSIPKSVISDKAVDSFVQKLIDDPNTNIYGFPDSMEKALYNKLLKTILHAVAHISDESAILLFGHRIRIFIEPLDKEKEEMN